MRLYKVWRKGKLVQTPYPGRYAGIKTQMVFGRLDCKGGMRAKKENREFFFFWEDAIEMGYRPCMNCKPRKRSRRDCDHMPFGLLGGFTVEFQETRQKKIRVICALCAKKLGYAKKTKNGEIRWKKGIIIHEPQ